jgi:cbb3-type cytochrome oxidase subunit 3
VSPVPCELVAIVDLNDWLPFGKTLSAIALGALLVLFLALVFAALKEGRRRKRAREVDPKFLDQPPRRTDFLWEERYGGKDYQ